MLHSENRKARKKGYNPLIAILAIVGVAMLMSCKEKTTNPNKELTMEAFSDLKKPSLSLRSPLIRKYISTLWQNDKDSSSTDYSTRRYYRDAKPFLWIDRFGVDDRADSVVAALKTVVSMGFTERSFRVADIEHDIERVRSLDFDSLEGSEAINSAMARIEYNLTKAYLRFVAGQRFGYVNPLYALNRLDVLERDTAGNVLSYRRLYDVDIKRPDKAFVQQALSATQRNDSLGYFLRQSKPTNPNYYKFLALLDKERNNDRRRLILCNMERMRWNERTPPDTAGRKYVIVNIPAYHLYAYSPDTIVDMRVGCGSIKTKTPLLVSNITRMDVNPVWNIPKSIITQDIAHHAGDAGYFARHRYYVVERKTGKRIDIHAVTAGMLYSGDYRVTQEGGEGNALGRIIFRFPNNFSVFLHDTSSRGVFNRDDRGVSHGCVRVERPFDLACFLLDEPDEWLLDRLRISMGLAPKTERGIKYMENATDNPRLLGSLDVPTRVPLYIGYYTLYPDASGQLQTWPDVYSYDAVIWRELKPLFK